MKKILLIAFSLFAINANGQLRKIELFAGIGNNGQVENVINDYFYETDPLYLMDNTYDAKFSSFKYNIGFKWNIKQSLGLRIRYGHSKTSNTYNYDSPELDGTFKIEQLVTNINPALCLGESVGKFRFSTGLEFAFYRVGNFNFTYNGSEYVYINNELYQRQDKIEYIVDGGNVTGINSFVDIEFDFSKRFSFGMSASYGMMFAKFGDQTTERSSFIYPTGAPAVSDGPFTFTEDKQFKKKYFSAPEISFSLIFCFGKPLEVK